MVSDEDAWELIELIDQGPLQVTYPWHFVREIGDQWARLRFIAGGHWSCLGDAFVRCDPDGHVGLGLPADQLLVPKCAPGALIGKLGGSVAGREDGTLFVIGSRSLVSLEKKNTFLYIGVNGAVPRATYELESIRLEISGVPAT